MTAKNRKGKNIIILIDAYHYYDIFLILNILTKEKIRNKMKAIKRRSDFIC